MTDMSWARILAYSVGAVGGLGAALLLALFVALATGADARGAIISLVVFLPAWAAFGCFFGQLVELKRLLERVLLTLALEAFALPIAGLVFAVILWFRFDPVGEQTVVSGQAAGLLVGALTVILGTTLIAVLVGGPSFLLFLLLKFNLVHLGRAIKLEAQRRIDEPAIAALVLVLVLSIPGSAPAQSPAPSRAAAAPLAGVWTQPFYAPCVRASLFIDHAEQGALGALLPLDRFRRRILAVFGADGDGEAPELRAARRRLESYVFTTGNPNLRVGTLRDAGDEVEGEIVTHSRELVERLRVDKRTGALRVER